MHCIEVHNYTDAVHYIFMLKSKPKTVQKAFARLADWEEPVDRITEMELWDVVNANTGGAIETHWQNDFTGRFNYWHADGTPSGGPRHYVDRNGQKHKVVAFFSGVYF